MMISSDSGSRWAEVTLGPVKLRVRRQRYPERVGHRWVIALWHGLSPLAIVRFGR